MIGIKVILQFSNPPGFTDFFSKYVKLDKPDFFFCLWRISRTVTERLRILIHISNYFQTLEILEKKTPLRTSLYISFGIRENSEGMYGGEKGRYL